MSLDLILGTAGHIDHGKTALIKALTGIDTDRLPEEKKRGITIELGFAQLVLDDVRLGIVDVPGHERFVRTMLAGATGIDLALLVVAADESVKPQTREHVEILRLLDLQSGVIALTKCDLADPDWVDLVEAEVRELVADTFLANANIVRTSAHTGRGLEQLRAALTVAARDAADRARGRQRRGPFRMAIDRSFIIAGHGTVVTGSVVSGQARVGDALVIEPGGVEVRVRGLQNHDQPADEVHRGQRAAINLAGIAHDEIRRGQELAALGHLVPSTLMTARIHLLPSAPRPLKNRARVHLHVGTAESIASITLLDKSDLKPGEPALAQLFLRHAAVTTWNQPLILRSESPVVTIGGGVVLEPAAEKIRRGQHERVDQLALLESPDPVERASAALFLAGLRKWKPDDLARTAGVDDVDAVTGTLRARGDLHDIQVSPSRSVCLHRQTLADLSHRVEKALGQLHEQFPLDPMIQRSRLAGRFDYLGAPALFDAVLERMSAAGRVRLSDQSVCLADHGPQLSSNEQQLMEEIVESVRTAGCQPPTVAEAQKRVTKNQASVPQLFALAAAEGRLVCISKEIYLHANVESEVRKVLEKKLAVSDGLTLSQIRETLNTTRKFAVPICEYLDRTRFTRRQGDLRVLAKPAERTQS